MRKKHQQPARLLPIVFFVLLLLITVPGVPLLAAEVAQGGYVYSFGEGSYGQLGHGDENDRHIPTRLEGLSNVRAVSSGIYHSLVLLENGEVYSIGGGQGRGHEEKTSVPVRIEGLSGVRDIAAGTRYSLVLLENGDVYSFGDGGYGRLGLGHRYSQLLPERITSLGDAKAVSAGVGHALVLLENGHVYSFGANNYGELGLGDTDYRLSPTRIEGLDNLGVKAIAAGAGFSLVLLENGDVYSFGNGSRGRLGQGDVENRLVPAKIEGVSNARAVSAGLAHALVLLESGEVYSFGLNSAGHLGHGDTLDRLLPEQIAGLSNVKDISAGAGFSLVLLENGDLYSFGVGSKGQLGHGDEENRLVPTRVETLSNVRQLTVGSQFRHSLVVTGAGVPAPEYTVLLDVSPQGGGSVVPVPGEHTVAPATVQPITATPAAGYAFSHWGVNGFATVGDPYNAATTFTLTGDGGVTAYFTPSSDNLRLHQFSWVAQGAVSTGVTVYDMCVDSQGNSYITGHFHGTVDTGTQTLDSGAGNNIFVASLDTEGNWRWFRQAESSGFHAGRSIAVDSRGDVYVTGIIQQPTVFGNVTLENRGEPDVFVAKLDGAGNWLWAEQAVGGGMNVISLAVDDRGNSFITGSYADNALFGEAELTGGNLFLAKLDTDGRWLWARGVSTDGSRASAFGKALALDGEGSLYLAGTFGGIVHFGGTTLEGDHWQGLNANVFIAKLDADGQWLGAQKTGYRAFVNDLLVDGEGSLYLAGYFPRVTSFGNIELSSNGYINAYVAKMDVESNIWLWAKRAGEDLTYGRSLAVNSSGNVYLAGTFSAGDFGETMLQSRGGTDIFLAKLDADGTWLWAQRTGGADSCLGMDGGDNLYLAGVFGQSADFGERLLESPERASIFMAKLVKGEEQGEPGEPTDPVEEVTDMTPANGPETVTREKIWTILFSQPFAPHSINAETIQVLNSIGETVETDRGYFEPALDPKKIQVRPSGGRYTPGEYTLRISGVVSQQPEKTLAKPVILRFVVE